MSTSRRLVLIGVAFLACFTAMGTSPAWAGLVLLNSGDPIMTKSVNGDSMDWSVRYAQQNDPANSNYFQLFWDSAKYQMFKKATISDINTPLTIMFDQRDAFLSATEKDEFGLRFTLSEEIKKDI